MVAGKTYYVKPHNASCPPNSECHTLNDYIANSSQYFTNFTTFSFLSGMHLAKKSLSVSGVQNLTLTRHGKAEAGSAITCSNNAIGFMFSGVQNLLIEKLSISHCGGPWNAWCHGNSTTQAALSICNCSNVSLSEMAIVLSNGQGLLADNTGGTFAIRFSDFSHNTATKQYYGGNAIFFSSTVNSTLQIYHSTFSNNSNTAHGPYAFASGLLLVLRSTDVLVDMVDVNLTNNSGGSGGNMAIVIHHVTRTTSKPVSLRSSFVSHGNADAGGGLYLTVVEHSLTPTMTSKDCQNESRAPLKNPIVSIQSTVFRHNTAINAGGAIYSRQKESLSFCSRGIIEFRDCTFEYNTLSANGTGGAALYSVYFTLPEYVALLKPQFSTEIDRCIFSNNSETQPWKYSSSGVVMAIENPKLNIVNTTFESNDCSAIVAISSNVILAGSIDIKNNRASSGTGLFLCQNSKMFLKGPVNVSITGNTAADVGGGIYAANECLDSQPACFFQLTLNSTSLDAITVGLWNNNATFAGHAVYGGSIEYCYMLGNTFMNDTARYNGNHTDIFNQLFHYTESVSSITSTPHHICLCEEDKVDCYKPTERISAYPGQSIRVRVAIVGQLNGLVPGLVIADFDDSKINIESLQSVQNINDTRCTALNFTIYSNHTNGTEKIALYAQHYYDINILKHGKHFVYVSITVAIQECPQGFEITTAPPYHCDCTALYTTQELSCNITTQQITRRPPSWLGSTNTQNTTILLFHKHCPFDYCLQRPVNISVTPQIDQNAQCDFNRSGTLCGSCLENHSIVFGTSNCKQCHNTSLFFLVVPAVAGILLVVVLTALNLTVTEGTLHGLIFYANIVQINSSAFFSTSKCWYTQALEIFIAWLNLDIGIEVCFYDGMDAYAKAWLQFAFPLYILFISGCIVYLCKKSTFVANLAGKNAVKVLATLVLLSYAKLLRALITSFSFVNLHTATNHVISVWLSDGNLLYLQGKHIPLFIFSVAFGGVCLPYALTLLLIHQLEKHSQLRVLFHIRKLKPFLDAYTGVYTNRGRCWTGLLLLARLFLFSVYAFNITGDPRGNFTAGMFTSILIIVLGWVVRPGIYKKWTHDVLEASFHLNLASLFLAASYFNQGKTLTIAAGISVTTALILFTGIIAHHSCKKCDKFQHIRKVLQRITSRCIFSPSDHAQLQTDDSIWQQIPQPDHCDQDREPLLARVE